LHIFSNSLIPNGPYYKKILKTRFFFSLKYFVFLTVILNFFLILNLLNRYPLKKISHWLNQINIGLNQFPKDLNIFIQNGVLTSTYNRPYFVWAKDTNDKIKLILVIDESASFEKINQYQSLLLLTKNDLIIKINREIKKIPLSSFNSITINQQYLTNLNKNVLQLKKSLYLVYSLIFLLLIVFIPLFSFVINLFYLFLGSLIVFLLLKIKPEKKYHFKKVFQISFHASTLPLILNYLIFILPLSRFIKIKIPITSFPLPLIFLSLIIIFIFSGTYEAYLYNHHKNNQH